ncbi:MAG TPA: DUF2786 domain-containing protein [Jatrophihabitans sp.]|jgi:hypothetical protein|nr:DUF2786 domain-containing protein [Jatrophihabitans sp.]
MRPTAGPRPLAGPADVDAARLLRAAALARAVDEPDCADRIVPLLQGRLALRPHAVDRAVDATVRQAAHDLLTRGWRPAEVVQFAASRLDAAARSFLLDALAGTAQWTAGAPWLPELRAAGARVWWSSARPHVTQWAERHAANRAETLRVVVDALAVLAYVPRTDTTQPGMPAPIAVAPDTLVADEKVAGRVDALLARAVATDHPEEGRAAAAKAQELLLRYASVPAVRRRVLHDPRRLVAAVGAEVAGLLQRAAAAFTRPARPAALAAGEAEPAQLPNGRSW